MGQLKITMGNEQGCAVVTTSERNLRLVLDDSDARIVEDLIRTLSYIPKCNNIEQRVNGIDYMVEIT
jgi:hypothetical protein